MKKNKLTIGLFGFGCVGYGLYEVLDKTPALNARIKKICVRDKSKLRPIDPEHFTFNPEDILDDPEIDTIIELIDDADAAFTIVSSALQRGKAVVSANKKMIAEHFSELLELQRKFHVPLLYEAACCASIPILRNLEEYYDNDLLESVEGIVNGSTNYILTKIANEPISYAAALKEAQQNGYAESNPILDTGGFDARYKLQILIAHAFGVVLQPEAIFKLGIDRIGDPELAYAREKGLKIKLVAFAEKSIDGKISAAVLPKFVRPGDKLYSVDGVFNGVKIKSNFSDVQFFEGRGAGAYPTASAVLSDVSALSYDYRYGYKKLQEEGSLQPDSQILFKVLLRHSSSEGAALRQYFVAVYESYSSVHSGFIIGTVSLQQLKNVLIEYPDTVSVVMIDSVSGEDITGIQMEEVLEGRL